MLSRITLEEDLALKRLVTTPRAQKPAFDWGEALAELSETPRLPEITIARSSGAEERLSLSEVADEIGNALTDLLLAREETEIFTEANRAFVANVAHSLASRLIEHIHEGQSLKLSEYDLSLLIEKALIENDAHDVAKTLVFKRSHRQNAPAAPHPAANDPLQVRLIRRNGSVVPWNEAKIEAACRKSFLSVREDPEPSALIARAVTARVRSAGQAFIHIEDVQDLVQEELMRQGFYKVAESYILYRAHRARLRDDAAREATPSDEQQSLVVVRAADGQSVFWDGSDLKKRIAFASIGLDLSLDSRDIERELRRSIGAELTREQLQSIIIMNARALIERDADFAKFAGRILLTYIYEEVLDWRIERDGIEGLREAHRAAFKSYLRHGAAIERLSPKLLSFALDKLADALAPSADLDFDYLGIQTLYDRYLLVDKTGPTPRRFEAPQHFWM
ncbi:MAG: ATP cone domain-containing protein, partial [Terrimicrobiaceae bacterium]|nr:ATP cone domain-containing protein [Terrimicrobiaceae bacterium]